MSNVHIVRLCIGWMNTSCLWAKVGLNLRCVVHMGRFLCPLFACRLFLLLISSYCKHERATTFTRTSCNIMLHSHSHPWGSRLTTLLLAGARQFFVSMVNWHTCQDRCCPLTMCICLIPSFTYMILMRHLTIVFLEMKTFLWIRWRSFNKSCEHAMHILHCISMHMKSCKGMMHLITPSSFVSFQAMIDGDTTCPRLMKLGLFYQAMKTSGRDEGGGGRRHSSHFDATEGR